MAIQRFDESYDRENCIDSCRFWLMLKMKGNDEHWDNKYDIYLNELRSYLGSMNKHSNIVEKELTKIQLSAYRTITESFFK
jgi:hypothetical protein